MAAAIQQSQAKRHHVRSHHKKHAMDSVSNIQAGAYILALREKYNPYPEQAMNVAAISAVRRVNICRARKYMTGVISVPQTAGKNRITVGVNKMPPGTRRIPPPSGKPLPIQLSSS